MNDEDLIRDIEQATRRLDASLKVCRSIIDRYQSNLSGLARDVDGVSASFLLGGPRCEDATQEGGTGP